MSGTMRKLTGVTADTAARFANLQAKADSLKQHTSDFGNTVGGLKQKLDLLRSERDLIDVGDIDKIREYDKNIGTLEKRIGTLEPAARKAQSGMSGFIETAWKFNQISELFDGAARSIQNMTAPGIEFEKNMADLSAITGIAGEELKGLGKTARNVGKQSGLGASGAVEAYKLLASQIDVSKIGIDGLNKLQSETIKLAQASGMQLSDAANSMAGTINQFGLEADQATRIINILAAGSKYGAAEIPELSQSFKVVGASASAAGLNVESTAGAIETLSKMNLKGAEAGTALRNILLKMQTELGVDLRVTKLSDALAALEPKMNDAAFMAKTFGAENIAAAQFLAANADMVDEMTQRVTNTNVAYEQAAINTDTVSHKMSKLSAWFDNVKISIFEATKPMLSYISATTQSLSGVAQMVPLITGLGAAFSWLKTHLWTTTYAQDGYTIASKKFTIWEKIKAGAIKVSAAAQWIYNGAAVIGGAVMAWLKKRIDGLRKSMLGAGAGAGVMSGLMGVASVAARVFGVAIKGVSKAIYAIPIVGWIAAAISGLIALFTLLWKRSEKFRGLLFGLWESAKAIFHNIGVFFGKVYNALIKPVFDLIGAKIAWLRETVLAPLGSFFARIWGGITGGLRNMGETFSNIWGWITGMLERVGLRFTSFWDFMKSLFVTGAKIMFWPFTLLMKLFPNLGDWLEEKVWAPIKAVFEKITQRIGKLIEPIKKIWGKLFKGEEYKDVSEQYAKGEEKGKKHYRDEQERKKKEESGGIGDLMAGIEGESNALNLNPAINIDGGKGEKSGTGMDTGKGGPSLGVPMYNQSSGYLAVASKFGQAPGANEPGMDKPENPTEKPVKTIAARVEEIGGSLRKMAAVAAIPVAMTMGAAGAQAKMPSYAQENQLANHVTEVTETINSPGMAIDNSRTDNRNRTTHNTTNEQGKTVYIDRFTDKIEINVSGNDDQTSAATAERIRDEVEKALAEILNV